MDASTFLNTIKLSPPMSNLKTSNRSQEESNYRWIVSHATSSHPDYGPDLIAIKIDGRIAGILREQLGTLHSMVESGRSMIRIQWLGASVEFFREEESESGAGGLFADLREDAPLLLPPETELPGSCVDQNMCAECEAFTMLQVNPEFAPEVYALGRIKNTRVEVESKHDLWPLIQKVFPAPQTLPAEAIFSVAVRGCSAEQAEMVIRKRLDPDEDYGFPYTLGWSKREASRH